MISVGDVALLTENWVRARRQQTAEIGTSHGSCAGIQCVKLRNSCSAMPNESEVDVEHRYVRYRRLAHLCHTGLLRIDDDKDRKISAN